MAYVISKINDQVGSLTFNRPDKFNSFVRPMAFEVQDTLDEFEENDDVRCICITGTGKAFSAGQDLQEATDETVDFELSDIVADHFNPIIKRLRYIEKPIVGAVNGVAAGAGANIALACDLTVAKESASFIQAFSKIGLIPDSGGTWMLPRLVGLQRATALTMLGEKISAQQAEDMGMIYRSVVDEEYDDAVDQLCKKLANLPSRGLGLTKKALNKGFQNDLDTQLDLEEKLQSAASKTHDYEEGTRAFLEKRSPEFKGK